MYNDVIGKIDRRRTRHMENPEREVLRQSVLEAAIRLLADEGATALSVRRLAQEVDRSTMVVYTLFGGREGVVEGLYVEGFRRLWLAVASPSDDLPPLEQLWAIARAYRAYALSNPTLYAVMFGGAVPDFVPTQSGVRDAHLEASTPGEVAVGRCIEAGMFREGDPVEMADVLWATVHGVVSLELARHFPEPREAERRFELALRTVLRGLRRSDHPESLSRTHD